VTSAGFVGPETAYAFAVAPMSTDTDKARAGPQYPPAKLDPPVDVIGGGEPTTDDEWAHDSGGTRRSSTTAPGCAPGK
jgi:hypothetical protein